MNFLKHKVHYNNIAKIAIAIITGKAISFIWKILLLKQGMNYLGSSEVLLTTITLLTAFSTQGFPQTITRYVGINRSKRNQEDNHKLLSFSVKLVLFISIIIVFGSLAISLITSNYSDNTIIPLWQYVWIIPLLASSEIIWAYLNGKKKIATFSFGKYISQPLVRLSSLAIIIYFFLNTGTKNIVVLPILLAAVFTSAVAIAIFKKVYTKILPDKETIYDFVKYSLTINGSFFVFMIYGASSVYWVQHFLGTETVGSLSIYLLVTGLLEIAFLPFLNLLQTQLANYKKDKRQGFKFISLNILALFSVGVISSLVIYFVKDAPINLLNSISKIGVLPLLPIFFAQSTLHNSIILPLRHYMDFYKLQKESFYCILLALVFKIITMTLLIPLLGLLAVVVGNIAGDLIQLLVCGIIIHNQFKKG